MHVLIIGLGVSGSAARAFCEKRGDRITVYDDALAPGPLCLEGIDLAVKSPGIPFSHPFVQAVQKRGISMVGEIDLALSEIRGKTLYAITGSNGKTTTTLLAAHLLNTAGKKAVAVGNVGKPLISQIDADVEFFVIELSSFQLESIKAKAYFDAGALLNLTPNHLDRHKTFEAYAKAKLRLVECLKEGAPFFVGGAVAKQYNLSGIVISLESISSLSYRDERFYPHDWENIAAAYALTGVDRHVLQKGLATFKKPPHRIEFVRQYKGITFINDSKSTSIDAVAKAVEAMQTPVVLIAGGVDKGGEYAKWIPLFRGKVRKAFLMGEAAKRIECELSSEIVVEKVADLEEGVKKAALFAKKGETVLLSPGCSSYDQFKNYEDRGDRFKEMVSILEETPL
ncbi:MAG: UDP-N-acetylmuramoyl-L-alanine--D-glutamate ligase [Chlamydiales bacterium]|nr:UDP-N-acetylmuramoyl-L-alanine--D-glutamate ligase [Chlamydiales bacterium]